MLPPRRPCIAVRIPKTDSLLTVRRSHLKITSILLLESFGSASASSSNSSRASCAPSSSGPGRLDGHRSDRNVVTDTSCGSFLAPPGHSVRIWRTGVRTRRACRSAPPERLLLASADASPVRNVVPTGACIESLLPQYCLPCVGGRLSRSSATSLRTGVRTQWPVPGRPTPRPACFVPFTTKR
jgi:hypothetical protein